MFHRVCLKQVWFRSNDANLMDNFISYVKIIIFLFIRPTRRMLQKSRSSAIWQSQFWQPKIFGDCHHDDSFRRSVWTETIDTLQKAILKSRLLGKSRTVFLLFLLIFGIFSLTLQRGKGYGSFYAGVCACGGIGRRVGLRIQWFRSCRFESCQAHMRYL